MSNAIDQACPDTAMSNPATRYPLNLLKTHVLPPNRLECSEEERSGKRAALKLVGNGGLGLSEALLLGPPPPGGGRTRPWSSDLQRRMDCRVKPGNDEFGEVTLLVIFSSRWQRTRPLHR